MFGAALKDRFKFERPWSVDGLPVRRGGKGGAGVEEIRMMIGAKMEPAFFRSVCGRARQELGLQDSMFVVTGLGPRIGKQDKQGRYPLAGGNGCKEEPGLGPDKMEIRQPRSIPLLGGAFHALADQIDSDTDRVAMCCSVGGEKVPMPAAYFPNEGRGSGEFFP